jgi:hypothetical protein
MRWPPSESMWLFSVDDPDVLQAFEQAYATSGDEGYWTWRLERLGDQARRTGKTPSAQLAICARATWGQGCRFRMPGEGLS